MAASRKTDWPTLGLLLAMYVVLIGNFVWHRVAPLPLARPRRDRGRRDPPRLHDLARGRSPQRVAPDLAQSRGRRARHVSLHDAVLHAALDPPRAPRAAQRTRGPELRSTPTARSGSFRCATRAPLGYARKLLTRRSAHPRRADLGRALGRSRWPAIFALAWWFGALRDALWLWLVPVVIAKLVMDWYINYLPHAGLPPRSLPGHAHRRSGLAHAARPRAQLPRRPSSVARDPVARLPRGVPGEDRLPEGAWRSDRTRDLRHRTPAGHGLCEPPSPSLRRAARCAAPADAEVAATGFDFEYDTAPNEFRFLRCRGCAHVYLSPRPAASELVRHLSAELLRLRRAGQPAGGAHAPSLGGRQGAPLPRGGGPGPAAAARRRLRQRALPLAAARIRCAGLGAGGHRLRRGRRGPLPRARLRGACRPDRGSPGRRSQLRRRDHAPADRARGGSGRDLRERSSGCCGPGASSWSRRRTWAASTIAGSRAAGGATTTSRATGISSRPPRSTACSRPPASRSMRSEYLISTSSWTISLHNYLLDRGWPARIVRFFHYQNPLLLGLFVVLRLAARAARLETRTSG